MSKYIDAEQIAETYLQRARSEWRNVKEGNAGNAFAEASYIALHYPAADVQEVKHGRWIKREYCSNYSGYDYGMKCSVCGKPLYRQLSEKMPNYCPNCGARMDGKEE